MENKEITIHIGSLVGLRNGGTQDDTRPVSFKGSYLASVTTYSDPLSDTRGVTQTLYRVEDGRLVVHIEDWSRWQSEPTVSSLVAVTERDLGLGGPYERLGREAGYGRPLTLDEALA
jgi:hypothetical protein